MQELQNVSEREAMQSALQFAAERLPAIRRIAARALSKTVRGVLIDELVSELVFAVPRWCENYDSSFGTSLWCFVRANAVWFARKWATKKALYGNSMRKSESRNIELDNTQHSKQAAPSIDVREEVLYLIEPLSEYDRLLLTLRHVHDLTYTEIATRAGIPVSTARVHCMRALDNARQLRTSASQS